jgi:hypothetical protein
MAEEVIKIELIANLEKELHKLPTVETQAQAAAEAIAARAREFAPVDTGKYKAGIKVQKTNKRGSGIWRVLASDQKSFWVEFGVPSRDIQGVFPLRQAVESLGLTWAKRKR